MIPILYESTVTDIPREKEDGTFNRINWGLGLIKDAKSAVVTEELGGDFTAEIVLPVSSQVYPELQVDRIIGLWCPYKTYRRTIGDTHIKDEGGRQPFRIVSISKPMAGMVTVKCEHVSAQTKRIIMKPRPRGAVQYHYEYFNDLDRAGALPFIVDISEIKQGSSYVRCRYADNYAYDRIEIWDCTQEFDTAPTAQQLTDWAAAYMERNNWGVPNVSITVDLVTQAGSLGYNADAIKTPDITADQEVYLGDSVEVIFERLGINTTARVKKYEFDSLRERYKKVEIGTIKPSITKSLAAVFKKTGVKLR